MLGNRNHVNLIQGLRSHTSRFLYLESLLPTPNGYLTFCGPHGTDIRQIDGRQVTLASRMETQPSIPEDVTDLPWITNGISGATFAVSESAIIKIPLPIENCKEQLAIERQIYERLGPHPYITKLLYTHKGMIVLERLQYPLRRRLLDIRKQKQLPVAQDVVRWARQTTQALQHIHSRGVMQVDIGPHNILLDWDENVKLSDFVGSSLDGSEPMVFPSAHSEHPDMPTANPSV